MDIQIKKTVKAGNSSAVILPRSWLNKEVRVELAKKTSEIILSDVIEILKNHIKSGEIIGIYLAGSYARGEEDMDSDIDVLVITEDVDREIISEGIYNILIVSKKLLKQKLERDLLPIGQMIKEANPLLNSGYLNTIEVKVTKNNIKWYIETTRKKLEIVGKVLDKTKKNHVGDEVVYTLVLRIKTLYIIKRLIENKDYSKKEFVKTINGVSHGNNAYDAYLTIKNNKQSKNRTSVKETENLYNYAKDQLSEVEELIRNLR